MDRIELTVLMPVRDEEAVVSGTLAALRRSVRAPHRVLCVYDRPGDTTVPAVLLYRRRHPEHRVELLFNDYGPGVVNALKKGFAAVRTDFCLVVMGDLSDDLARVDQMLARAGEGFDIVCGSRYMPGGRHIGGPVFKRALSRLAGVSLHILTGIPTRDPTNSFKMYRTQLLRDVTLESDGGFELGMEVVAKAWIGGRPITEVPATWRDRTAGRSKFRLFRWLPKYLRWYLLALEKNRLAGRFRRG